MFNWKNSSLELNVKLNSAMTFLYARSYYEINIMKIWSTLKAEENQITLEFFKLAITLKSIL